MSEIKVRELTAKDLKTLVKMLGKLKPASKMAITAAMTGKKSAMDTGVEIFSAVAADLTEEIYAWLADLVGLKVEELDKQPFSYPVEIVKALIKQGSFGDFLGRAGKESGKEDT